MFPRTAELEVFPDYTRIQLAYFVSVAMKT